MNDIFVWREKENLNENEMWRRAKQKSESTFTNTYLNYSTALPIFKPQSCLHILNVVTSDHQDFQNVKIWELES